MYALPGRNRRTSARIPGQAAQGSSGRRIHQGRFFEGAQDQCQSGGCNQREPLPRSLKRQVQGRFVLPSECGDHNYAFPQGQTGRH